MVRQTLAAMAVSLMVAAPTWAGETTRARDTEALMAANQKLAQAEQGAGKPAQAQIVRQQRQQVQDLLDQLQAGRRVDPAQLDRVLQQADRPF